MFKLLKPNRLIPPKPPEYGECCGSNCNNCVWKIYVEKLEKYKKMKENNPLKVGENQQKRIDELEHKK